MKAPKPVRHIILQLGFLAVLVIIASRLGYLQIVQHDFFTEKSRSQLKRIINIFPNRGHIYDRDMQPLALTKKSFSVFAVPPEIENNWVFAKRVAPYLGMTRKELSDKLYATKSPFLWLKRQVEPDVVEALKELNIKGVGFIPTQQRVYPHRELFSHILGFVGVDNQGLGGLEYKYDTHFKGSPGKIILERDPRGFQLISGRRETIPPQDGGHIVTTLDPYIQYFAQKYLEWGVHYNEAEKGQVIVMDPQSGDVLAMASYPEFDPNKWTDVSSSIRKNTAIVDVYEPGSIFKVLTIAAALEERVATPGTVITVPETLRVYDRTISEAHDREEGETDQKTVAEILQYSLNVGTSLVAQQLGEERFYSYIKRFGFGQRTGIELPGESRGLSRPLSRWSKVDIAMISFGQGIAVTSLQMAAAVSAIVNDGIYMKPRIVQYASDHDFNTRQGVPKLTRKRVISKETSEQMREIMKGVVEFGTATPVRIKGMTVGGKTGTAQKAKENGRGYESGKYIASFVGFFPVEKPEYLILVSIDSPKKSIWGSTVAGPVFRKIAEDIIDVKNMPLTFEN
jgi:cell division protein FtsI/penicillin-binding protein 2